MSARPETYRSQSTKAGLIVSFYDRRAAGRADQTLSSWCGGRPSHVEMLLHEGRDYLTSAKLAACCRPGGRKCSCCAERAARASSRGATSSGGPSIASLSGARISFT